jgi:predicted glycosyltransferase involved in capsule biosynthesis
MKKIDLEDVSFLIPVRIDSKERFENINWIIEFIWKYFNTTIIVLEADETERFHNSLVSRKIFVKDHDRVFHRTKYINKMIRESTTDLIAVWDTDVFADYKQILKAVTILRQEKIEIVFPFDGRFFRVPQVIRTIYKETKDFNILVKNQEKFLLYYWHHFVGGAFIVNRKAYIESGMENENFYGWGPEDEERVKRREILGFKLKRVQGPMFHLEHPRNNSWFASKELEIQNRNELIKVCRMDKRTLLLYISSFKWCW